MDNQIVTQTNNRITNDARVGTFTTIAGIIAGVLMAGIIAGSVYHPLWYCLSAGAGASGIMFVWRVYEHDKRSIQTFTKTSKSETENGEYVRAGVILNGGRTIRLGKYALTHKEWHKLCNAIFSNDGRFTRDVIAGAGVFKNITAKWRDIVIEFEQCGIISNGQLTDAGYTWFNKYVSPVPPTPKTNGHKV